MTEPTSTTNRGGTAANTARDEVRAATAAAQRTMAPQSVPVRMWETPGALVIVAPLPAVTAEDVVIDLRRGEVSFRAALRSAPEREYLLDEWEFGGYERTVTIPEGYGAGAEASLNNGQLAIRVLPGRWVEPISVRPGSEITPRTDRPTGADQPLPR